MANNANVIGDRESVKQMIIGDYSETDGYFEDDISTTVYKFLFYGDSNIKSINLPNVTTMGEGAFQSCSNLESVNFPKLVTVGQNVFRSCVKLKTIHLPELTTIGATCFLYSGNNSTIIVLPKLTTMTGKAVFDRVNLIEAIDLGENCKNLSSDAFYHNTGQKTINNLILRSKSVVKPATWGSINGLRTIYVPSSLISDYQTATNWSTGYNNGTHVFLPIEGSKYEYYWADGTPLGFENTSGMIAYYDVGNVNDWDSETKTITSHVENDFNAWRQTSNNQFNINNAADIPTNIYDNCYMSGGFIINFGDGTTSNISIEDKYDVITIEFLYASSSNTSININKAITNESLGTQIIGYVGGLGLTFKHVVLELSKTGMKLFVNKVLKISNNNNNIDKPVINISASNNAYIGHVSVWNRALTDEEIEEHYQYYVDNFHVGETAFDSSGNFIAGS